MRSIASFLFLAAIFLIQFMPCLLFSFFHYKLVAYSNGYGIIKPKNVEFPKTAKEVMPVRCRVIGKVIHRLENYSDMIMTWDSRNNSKGRVGSLFDEYEDIQEIAFRTEASYALCKYVHVSSANVVAVGNRVYLSRLPTKSPYWFYSNNGKIMYDIDTALISGHKCVNKHYGHWFQDYLLPLMIFPDEIIDKCYIVNQGLPDVSWETLIALGIRENQIINISNDGWFFAKNVYIVDKPTPRMRYYGFCIRKMQAKFRQYYKLDLINATKYYLSNRESKMRMISNWNKVVINVKLSFPEYNWEILPDYFPSMRETALRWAEIRYIFIVTGSNVLKAYFMKKGTVICIAGCGGIDHSQMKVLIAIGVYSRWFKFKGMKCFGVPARNIDIVTLIENMRYALFMDKYGKWPASYNFTL